MEILIVNENVAEIYKPVNPSKGKLIQIAFAQCSRRYYAPILDMVALSRAEGLRQMNQGQNTKEVWAQWWSVQIAEQQWKLPKFANKYNKVPGRILAGPPDLKNPDY